MIVSHGSLPLFCREDSPLAMPAARTDWTLDMLDALPDDGQRYELIDGELFVTPAPSDLHPLVTTALAARLYLSTSDSRRSVGPSSHRPTSDEGIERRTESSPLCSSLA